MRQIPWLVIFGALLAACAGPPAARLATTPVSFDALPGWNADRQDQALIALRRSCERLDRLPDTRAMGIAGTVADWRPICTAAVAVADNDAQAARAFFETWFRPHAASVGASDHGLLTGYYEPLLRGARQPDARFRVPIYGRPDDLVTIDLARFGDDFTARRIVGRVSDGRVVPYPDRAAIDAGALDGAAPVLAWVDDPIAAFFLQVQGSGRIDLGNGEILRVGYAGANGHAYVSIGRVLIERGAIPREAVSLQTIRAWLAANPDQAAAVMAENPSFVFFRVLDGAGPIGAQGTALVAGRSLAVDRRYIPYGLPIWLDGSRPATDPSAPDRPLRRLVIAQDTGGAIRGPLRGDLFWGFGARAEAIAGRMKHQSRFFLLLPRGVDPGGMV